jgi:hypothetical protein
LGEVAVGGLGEDGAGRRVAHRRCQVVHALHLRSSDCTTIATIMAFTTMSPGICHHALVTYISVDLIWFDAAWFCGNSPRPLSGRDQLRRLTEPAWRSRRLKSQLSCERQPFWFSLTVHAAEAAIKKSFFFGHVRWYDTWSLPSSQWIVQDAGYDTRPDDDNWEISSKVPQKHLSHCFGEYIGVWPPQLPCPSLTGMSWVRASLLASPTFDVVLSSRTFFWHLQNKECFNTSDGEWMHCMLLLVGTT